LELSQRVLYSPASSTTTTELKLKETDKMVNSRTRSLPFGMILDDGFAPNICDEQKYE